MTAVASVPLDSHQSGRGPTLQLLERGFAVLECFTVERDQWKMSDLARACQLPVPSAHRILAALERMGYVTRDPISRSYRLGPAAARLAARSRGVGTLRPLALPVIRRITAVTGQSSAVAVRSDDGIHSVVAAVVRGPGCAVQMEASDHLHDDALGLVLLSQLDEPGLAAYTRAIAAAPPSLGGELSRVRRRGWSLVLNPAAAMTWSMAVPIATQTGTFGCSVGVFARTNCPERAQLSAALMALRAGAANLSARLASGSWPD